MKLAVYPIIVLCPRLTFFPPSTDDLFVPWCAVRSTCPSNSDDVFFFLALDSRFFLWNTSSLGVSLTCWQEIYKTSFLRSPLFFRLSLSPIPSVFPKWYPFFYPPFFVLDLISLFTNRERAGVHTLHSFVSQAP